jgi:Domain of unknown function (DU1801)
MAKNKTTETTNSVTEYLNNISDEKKRKDCSEIIALIRNLTGLEPKMWGTGIVGFGSYHYKYASGHEGDAPLLGLAARANAIVLYLSMNVEQRDELLQKFGKHKTGKGCIYIQKLEDIDTNVLSTMVNLSIENKNQ